MGNMMKAAIKKSSGLDEIIRSYTPAIHEDPKQVQINHTLQRVSEHYRQAVEHDCSIHPSSARFQAILDNTQEILTPKGINNFMQALMVYENHPLFYRNTGLFITQLVRNSFYAGFSSFSFMPLFTRPLRSLFNNLRGTTQRTIDIIWHGDMDSVSLYELYHAKVQIMGSIENRNFGTYARHCEFTFGDIRQVDVGADFARAAKHCTFRFPAHLEGKVLNMCFPRGSKLLFFDKNGKEYEAKRYQER